LFIKLLRFYLRQKYVIPEEQAEWVGLSLVEAMHKQWKIEEDAGLHVSLFDKHMFLTMHLKPKLVKLAGIKTNDTFLAILTLKLFLFS